MKGDAVPDEPTVLAYEQNPEPPYLIREHGRVALVMPAAPRALATAVVATQAGAWVVFTAIAGMLLRMLWRARGAATPPGATAILLVLVGLPVFFGAVLAAMVRWWLTFSRVPPVLELCGDAVTLSYPGLLRTAVRRAGTSDVLAIRFTAQPGFGGYWVVRVRVALRGRWVAWRRPFFAKDVSIAERAQNAFSEALAAARGGRE